MAEQRVPVFRTNDLVFVPDEEFGFVPAEVTAEFQAGVEGKVRLKLSNNREVTVTKEESKLVERMDAQSYKDVSDMINLKMLNAASLLHNIRLRYMAEDMQIYTNIGAILVAMNPFCDLGLYTPEMEGKYLDAGNQLQSMPPHIFKVAEAAFMNMRAEDKDQSCVITGESGAGKTVTTKMFLQYVSEKSKRNQEASGGAGLDTEELRNQIIDSNPFMEAFGNAKTLRNNNSSRFGKLIEMFFDTGAGVVVGASITNYLLEKSRVVKVGKGERNYHIFYQLCAAATDRNPQLKKDFFLQSAENFRYTLGDNKDIEDLTISGENDADIFEETKVAMRKLLLTDEEIQLVFRICSGILHLGNVTFKGEDVDLAELEEGVEETALQNSGELLGVDPDSLSKAIIYRQLKDGIEKQHTVKEAKSARDALAKFVYEKLFDWLISRMNQAMTQAKAGRRTGTPRVIGVLDIFGFETFKKNSFEQMCINFCNEKLQAFFNLHVFKKEQAEYEEEGINVAQIGFSDNQGVIDVLEGGAKSVMYICDDACGFEAKTDKDFLNAVLSSAKQINDKQAHKYFLFRPRIQDRRKNPFLDNAFTIKHFAGFVHYNTEGYLEKNKDRLRIDLRGCIASSSIRLLADMFPGGADADAGRQKKYRTTLGTKFRQSLDRLMERLNLTTPQFVRCIKPNDKYEPALFTAQKTFKQLNEAGLLEVCKIRKLGYPIKKDHKQFMNDYLCIDKSANSVGELCDKLMSAGILYETNHSPNWQVGKTKVFLRSEQVYELEKRRAEALKEVLKIVQSAARKYVFRKRVHQAMGALKNIRKGINSRKPEILAEGLEFFISKGPLFSKLPIVIEGQEIMKGLQKQLDLINELKIALKDEDYGTIKVKLEVADRMKINDHPVVKDARERLEIWENQKSVNSQLESAIGSQSVKKLKSAISFAVESGFGSSKLCKQAENLLKTIEERETRIEMLRKEIGKENLDVDEIARLVEELRACGCSDDHPLIVEAARLGELVIERNQKREKKIKLLEKQLHKNLKNKNLAKLQELVAAAINWQYTGPLVTEAMDMIKNLQQRQDLLDEVSTASRVLKEKSKLADGIVEADLVPLRHAIKTACSVPRLQLEEEIQVIEGNRLIERMQDQIKVQDQVKTALVKENQQGYYKMLEKIQSLGLQTREADQLVQKVREFEMIKAKAEAIANDESVALLLTELRVQTAKERKKHMVDRIKKMYSPEFNKELKSAWKAKDLAMKYYYKVRSDADFVSREKNSAKEIRKKMKHAYEEGKPLTKSMLEMDDYQEKIAVLISNTITRYCDSLSANKRDSLESSMSFVVQHGICDPVIADEIYMQLAKHLTANLNPVSTKKGWYLLCLCSTYFGVSKMFLPYVLSFLQNTTSDVGAEGNYAKYVCAQLSSSLAYNPAELKIKPGKEEIRAFFVRPPVLAQLEMVDNTRKDVPIPPDFTLAQAAPIIRKGTKIMIDLKNPDWAIYIRATVKPAKLTWKTRLERFYKMYKPENLGSVDQILAYYKGQEQALFNDLTSTSNYGPEPIAPAPERKMRKGSGRSTRGESKSTKSKTPLQELDDIFADDQSEVMSVRSSASSVGSRLSRVGSVVSKIFRRARGLSTVNKEDLDVPNPSIAWPLPWWVYIGDVMSSLYEQQLVPVLTYKRRICKMKGKPDEQLYLQLQRDYLDSVLTPVVNSENPNFSAIILCVRLLKAGKEVPYGDKTKLLKAGLIKCIPRRLRKANKKNEEWVDAYLEVVAEKTLELRDLDVRQLQDMFYQECVNLPTYGMSFFFAQILKGSVNAYIAKAQTSEQDGAVKIGVNQHELAFFQDGVKTRSIPIQTGLQEYKVEGTTFTMKVKKTKEKAKDVENYELQLGKQKSKRRKSLGARAFAAVKGTINSIIGKKTETIQLYTLQPRELFDLIYTFKHWKPPEDE